jgi:hypothetical protein
MQISQVQWDRSRRRRRGRSCDGTAVPVDRKRLGLSHPGVKSWAMRGKLENNE